jgi:hypothetical protein
VRSRKLDPLGADIVRAVDNQGRLFGFGGDG